MMTKVVHITLSMDPGGIENLILSLAATINRSRFSLAVYCLDAAGSWFRRLQELGCGGLVFHRRPGLDVKLVIQLVKRFKKHPCHLVHTHNQAAHFYGGLAAKLAGIPCLITTEHSRHYIDERHRRRGEKRFLSCITDRWITVSRELANQSIDRDGVSPEKLSVIHNGIDVRRYSRPNEQVVSRKSNLMKMRLGIGPEERIVISIGRLHPVKNHALLLDAATILKDSGSTTPHVLLVGDGPLQEDLRRRTITQGLEKYVHFLGVREDVPDLLWMSDVFVLCSHSEGLPLSLLESWAAGVPVVVTRSANMAGWIQDGITGKVVENDARDLALCLAITLSEPEKYRTWVKNGLGQVQQKFSIQTMTMQYEHLYQHLLKDKGILLTNSRQERLHAGV